MQKYKRLSHTKWNCKYHIVFIPKRRRKVIFGRVRRQLREIFHRLARRKGVVIEEGYLCRDHVHMCLSIPPKYSISSVVGYLKGLSAIEMAKLRGRKRNFRGEHFWARGYFVSTVGLDEAVVREYIRKQDQEDARLDQLEFAFHDA